MRFLSFIFVLLGSSAAADWSCDDWWFTRNLVLDRAGYCFQSPLARSIFPKDCTGNVTLTADQSEMVQAIQSYEADFNCSVDTNVVRVLQIGDIATRLSLTDLPISGGYESGCIGYNGPAIQLRAGRSPTAPITGMIPIGSDIVYSFEMVGDWDFVNAGANGLGWAILPDTDPTANPGICDMYAG